ncbi:MAG: hypothetical protein WC565_09950 [Parcubacteria group bacterium]
MAWKTVFSYEGDEAIQDIDHVSLKLVRGKKYRVTVEEEVSECCEAWRGSLAHAYKGGVRARFAGEPKFCPECGRRL